MTIQSALNFDALIHPLDYVTRYGQSAFERYFKAVKAEYHRLLIAEVPEAATDYVTNIENWLDNAIVYMPPIKE